MVDYIRKRHRQEVEQIKQNITSLPEYVDIERELKLKSEDLAELKEEKRQNEFQIQIALSENKDELVGELNRIGAALASKIAILRGIIGGLIKRLRGIIVLELDNFASHDWDYSLVSQKNIELFNREFFGMSIHKSRFKHLVNHDLGKNPTAFTYSTVAVDRGNISGQNRKLAVVSDNQKLRYLGTDRNGDDIIKLHKARYPHGTLRVQRKTAEIMWSVWQDLCAYKSKSRLHWAFPLILVENEFQIITPEHLKYGYVFMNSETHQIMQYDYRTYCANGKNVFKLTEEQFKALPALSVDVEREIVKKKLHQEFIDNLTKEEYEAYMIERDRKLKISNANKEHHKRKKEEREKKAA